VRIEFASEVKVSEAEYDRLYATTSEASENMLATGQSYGVRDSQRRITIRPTHYATKKRPVMR
jgi:hypothetical protein